MNTGKDLCNHYISVLFLEMTTVNYHLAEESIVLIWSLRGSTVDYIKHMEKLPRNPGTEWYYFVLHRKPVCWWIHVYKRVKWFGLPVSEGRALYVADLLTSGVVHLLCQLWGSWDELKCQSGGATGMWELPQHSFSKGPRNLWFDSSYSLVQTSLCLLAVKPIYLCKTWGHQFGAVYLIKRSLGVRSFEALNNFLEGWLLLRKCYQFADFCLGLCL